MALRTESGLPVDHPCMFASLQVPTLRSSACRLHNSEFKRLHSYTGQTNAAGLEVTPPRRSLSPGQQLGSAGTARPTGGNKTQTKGYEHPANRLAEQCLDVLDKLM